MSTPRPPLTSFAERLRFAREQSVYKDNASKLSTDAGLAQAHVGMIERNLDASPSAETAAKLARALGVSLSWLITGEGEMTTRRRTKKASGG